MAENRAGSTTAREKERRQLRADGTRKMDMRVGAYDANWRRELSAGSEDNWWWYKQSYWRRVGERGKVML